MIENHSNNGYDYTNLAIVVRRGSRAMLLLPGFEDGIDSMLRLCSSSGTGGRSLNICANHDERWLRLPPTNDVAFVETEVAVWGNPDHIVRNNGHVPWHKMFNHGIFFCCFIDSICSKIQSFAVPGACLAVQVAWGLGEDVCMPQCHSIGKIP